MDIEAFGRMSAEWKGAIGALVAAALVVLAVLVYAALVRRSQRAGAAVDRADEAVLAAFRLRFGAGAKPGARSVMSPDVHDVEPTPDDERELPFNLPQVVGPVVDDGDPDDEPSEWVLRTLAAIRQAAALPYHLPAADREPKHLRASAEAADAAMHSGMTGFTIRLTDELLSELDSKRSAVAA